MPKDSGQQLRTLDQKEMGRRVRNRREAMNMSREDLSEKLGVSTQFVADIEYGNKGVSIRKLYLLCQILDVTADYVLAGNVYSRDEDVTYQDDVGSLDLFLVEEEVLCRISSSGSHVLSD